MDIRKQLEPNSSTEVLLLLQLLSFQAQLYKHSAQINLPFCLCLPEFFCWSLVSVFECHRTQHHSHIQYCPVPGPSASPDASSERRKVEDSKMKASHHCLFVCLFFLITMNLLIFLLTCFIIFFFIDSLCRLSPTEV